MSLTADRNTSYKDGDIIPVPVAATTQVFAGGIGAVNATGFLRPAADAAGLTVIGRIEEGADNSAGADGDLTVNVKRGKMFRWKNSGTNAVTQAHVGKNVYVEDDQTISSAGGTNNIVAGKCMGIDAAGVWVLPPA